MKKKLTSAKAKKILHDKEVHGQLLTEKQKRFFGAIAGGDEPYKAQVGTMVTPLDFSKPLGTLDGVSEVMSAPARTVTYLLTGKYQDPSQALGIKNPVGAFAVDAVLDPINLIGTGVASKAIKASKESGVLSKAYKLNPWAFKPNPEAYYRGIGNEGIKDALETGVIKSRDTDLFPAPYFARPNEFETALYYNPQALVEAKGIDVSKVKNIQPDQLIFRSKDAGAVPLNPQYVDEIYLGNVSPGFKQSYLENIPISNPNIKLLQKDWLRGYKEVKPPKKQDGGWLNKYDVPKAQNGIEGTMDGLTDKGFNYNGAWGGTMEMGGSLPGSVGFTYARTQGIPSEGRYAKKTLPSAQNGQAMKYYQEGLDFKPKTISQDGTVIDPDGYWNPENWGKPVIIPSTDITMEGVDQPLIGISNTGDVQYMEPGEDYEFDGEYVTEYPVAKNGVSVNNADAQPIKKLDQLLNFTNYNKPTKGGWLSKYE